MTGALVRASSLRASPIMRARKRRRMRVMATMKEMGRSIQGKTKHRTKKTEITRKKNSENQVATTGMVTSPTLRSLEKRERIVLPGF